MYAKTFQESAQRRRVEEEGKAGKTLIFKQAIDWCLSRGSFSYVAAAKGLQRTQNRTTTEGVQPRGCRQRD